MKTKKPRKKVKSVTEDCKCVELSNDSLKKSHNAVIDTRMQINFKTGKTALRIPIPVRKYDSDKKGKLPTLLASFCPICGRRIFQDSSE